MKKRNKRIGTTNFNKRLVFSLLIIIVVVMIGTYFYIDYKYGSISNMFLGETTQTTEESTSEQVEIKNVDGKKNLLFAVTSPGESEIYNIFMIGVNMTENKTSILSVPIYTKDSSDRTLEEEFKLGGISQVEYVLERMFSIDFDGYCCATQNGYKFFLTELGSGVSYNVPEPLQFSTTNYTVSLTAGEQELNFDTFVKLMRYEEWSGGQAVSFTRQGELLRALYEQYMKVKYVTRDVDKFTYRMTHIKTNISSETYVNDLDALEYIAATKMKLKVITPEGSFVGTDKNKRFTFSKDAVSAIHAAFTLAQVQ